MSHSSIAILDILDLLLNFFNNFSGGKRGHKGGRRHFTDPNALKMAKEKEEKEKEWRRARGEVIGKKMRALHKIFKISPGVKNHKMKINGVSWEYEIRHR